MGLEHHYHDVHERLVNGYGAEIKDVPIVAKRVFGQIPDAPLQKQITALAGTVAKLTERLAELEKRLTPDEYPSAPCQRIMWLICKQEGIRKEELLSKRRNKIIIRLRQMGYYLSCHRTALSLPQIGLAWNKDHTTIIHGRDKIIGLRKTDKALDKLIIWYEKALCELRV